MLSDEVQILECKETDGSDCTCSGDTLRATYTLNIRNISDNNEGLYKKDMFKGKCVIAGGYITTQYENESNVTICSNIKQLTSPDKDTATTFCSRLGGELKGLDDTSFSCKYTEQ